MKPKLVRDRVPYFIRLSGEAPMIRFAADDEMDDLLKDKLLEEVKEFMEAGDDVTAAAEELGDIQEVIYELAYRRGLTNQQLETLRREKRDRVGGFAKRAVWLGNRDFSGETRI